MTEQFINPLLNFQQRDRINSVEIQKNKYKQDFLTPLQLGKIVPEQTFDWYKLQYGVDYWNKHPEPTRIRPPPEPQGRPIPYLLNHTDEMLVDVCGTLYRNKDLKVPPFKSFGSF